MLRQRTEIVWTSVVFLKVLLIATVSGQAVNVENPIWSTVDSAAHAPGEPLSPTDYQNAALLNTTYEPFQSDPIELAGLFEGDIILKRGDAVMIHKNSNRTSVIKVIKVPLTTASRTHQEHGHGHAHGHDHEDEHDEDFLNRNAINQEVQKWPGGIIPYAISAQFNAMERSVIARAILNYQSSTCIKFRPRAGESDYIDIIKGKGCSSHVGRTGGAQPVILGEGCVYTGIATHELMHAIGFWHEQSRWDRDEHIAINFQNIAPGMDFNFRRYSWRDIQNLSAPYDTGSILHYGPFAFAKDKSKPTIVAMVPNSKMGQREALSQVDLLKINRLYNCNGIMPGSADSSKPSPSGQLKCVDSHVNCNRWAQRGECIKSSQFMTVNCRKSCNACNSPCSDANEYCDEWSRNDECSKNPDYMSIYCAKSCGTCPTSATGTPAESAAVPATDAANTVTECVDRHEHCVAWANRGECTMNPQYMLTYCQKSCNACVVY